MLNLVCAVDVGTGSARAGIFEASGRLLGRAERTIAMNRPQASHAEHDSENIWSAVCEAVRAALYISDCDPAAVKGIAFDATCSLVVRAENSAPLSVSLDGDPRWDTIVWLDHRALAQADRCTESRHRVLDFIGGVMSPEMQTPKLMWLAENLPGTWSRAGFFFDLADFLSWKACGNLARSQSTLTSKWTYLAHETQGWSHDFFDAMGIPDMLSRGALPAEAAPVGADLGCLSPQAAEALGLLPETRVASGLIDAHAGALGLIGGFAAKPEELSRHMALIAGTSSCVMAMTRDPRAFAGVWGPYCGAALPGFWLSEGGQSATGALLDHVIAIAGGGLSPDRATHSHIIARIQALRETEGPDLAGRLHVLPDFHGNRSPLADPHALGVISGLTLDGSFDSLCRLYWRTAVGIALGLRHILDALNENGTVIDTLHVAGGHTRSALLMQLYADATGCRVVEPVSDDAVLLGTAMAAAAGCGLHASLGAACAAMIQPFRDRVPDPLYRSRFERDYRIFLEMHRQRRALDAMG